MLGRIGTSLARCSHSRLRWNALMSPQTVPDVVFHTRVRNDALGGPNPFEWKDVSTDELFAGKNIVLFAVPGAFTPACSDSHLPGYERRYDEFRALGIDAVYCLAVNDALWLPPSRTGQAPARAMS